MCKKRFCFNIQMFAMILVFSSLIIADDNNLKIEYGVSEEIIITVSSDYHIKYGLSYPVTYQLSYSKNISNAMILHKHRLNDAWEELTEKSSDEFFNGVEVARFDYQEKIVFISLAFDSISDSIYVCMINQDSSYIRIVFDQICNYYDNRKAVVTTTADDLSMYDNGGFRKAYHEFRKRRLWLSCGVITSRSDSEFWNLLQKQLDSGYIEIDSHSRTHVHHPYPDVESEVVGSRDDIINNLDLPPLYSNENNEYVYCYIYPYGNWSSSIDAVAADANYLICRTVGINELNFTDWNQELKLFNRVGAVYEVGPDSQGVHGVSDINILKSTFDSVVNNGEIYHFTIHPKHIEDHGDWEEQYFLEHLDYISGHTNIWYVGFGQLYAYNLLTINKTSKDFCLLNSRIFLEGSYSKTTIMETNLYTYLPHNQPYKNAIFLYSGDENVRSIPNVEIVDWVLVSLYNNVSDPLPVKSRAGLLNKYGYIVDLDGESPLRFSISPSSFYIKIEHRNHLPVLSSEKIFLE